MQVMSCTCNFVSELILKMLNCIIVSRTLQNYDRAVVDDKPLRMVKTVLNKLVKLFGTAIKGHISMVPIELEP